MVFSSLSFLLCFLPLFLVGMATVGNTGLRIPFLMLISLGFYAWGEPLFVVVILGSIGCNHTAGRLIARAADRAVAWWMLCAAVAANLAALGLLKYAHFVAVNVDRFWVLPSGWLAFTARIPLPIGISFLTFHALSYVVDVYRKRTLPESSLVRFAAYVSMFPHLIAGPIVRYSEIREELDNPSPLTPAQTWSGLRTFAWGLGMKVILANPLGGMADNVFSSVPGNLSAGSAWFGALCYFGQIFFDFNGYSTMAIGLARCAGFTFPRNFADPYCAVSVSDFWRRWHMSLSSFFRDYVYIPLGGNRHGTTWTAINLMMVFLLCGLWHGAAWTFVAWGAYHGAFLSLERVLARSGFTIGGGPGRAYTFFVVLLGWVLFRAPSMAVAKEFMGAMAGRGSGSQPIAEFAPLAALPLLAVAAAVIYVLPWAQERVRLPRSADSILAFAAACLSLWLLVTGTHNPFIYFRF
jgi:alginate O-acetyltransferase complex protein AlgI